MTPSDNTRWSVVLGAAEGRGPDREAFARRYEPVIRAYLGARWRHSPLIHEIDDTVQEVFVDCFRPGGALGRVDPDGPAGFRGFLYGVVRIVALRAEEKRVRRRERTTGSSFEVAADDTALSVVFDRAWARSIIEQAGRLHAERAREEGDGADRRVEILRLRFREGLPVREIARRWDEDPARIHHEYAKARDEFRLALRDVVDLHHPGSHREVDAECARLAAFFR